MSAVVQNILALLIVAACVGFLAWQGVQTLRLRGGKIGSCCSKGCGGERKPSAGRVVFFPSEMLRRRR